MIHAYLIYIETLSYYFFHILWTSDDIFLSNCWRISIAIILILTICMFFANYYQRHLLNNATLRLSIQKESLNQLQIIQDTKREQAAKHLETICNAIHQSSDIKSDLCWNNYEEFCQLANKTLNFLPYKLKSFGITSEREIRLCTLVMIDCSYEEMSNMLSYSLSGIGKLKYMTAKKLGSNVRNLRKTLMQIAVSA